ncbi:MAG: MATE family efflux transporter, partial [Vicinamibacterales bacterium]
FLTAAGLAVILGAVGWIAAPALLDLVNAAPAVHDEALPFLRTMFVGFIGMMMFFMLSGAFRAAGDPQTPLRLGVAMTVLTIAFNLVLIPTLGTVGAAYGTIASSTLVSVYGIWRLIAPHAASVRRGDPAWEPHSVIHFERGMDLHPDFTIIRSLFRFGLPTGVQGIAMNVAGVMLLRFIGSLQQSAAAQAAYAIGYTELFSLITWTSVGLMGAAATIAGQNLGAGHPERAMQGVHTASRIGIAVAAGVGLCFVAFPGALLGAFGATEAAVATLGEQLLQYLAVSGFFITLALTYTGGLQGTGDTRSPLFITLASQIAVPIGMCAVIQATRELQAEDIWLAIVLGHFTRCVLTVARFRQGKWRTIQVVH